jgi:hypothetical protein
MHGAKVKNRNYMLRRPKRSKNEVVAPKEEEEE